MKKIKINFKNIIDVILVILLVVLSIKKGGFYKTDAILVNLVVCIIGASYIVYHLIKDIKSNNYKVDYIAVILLLLPIAYMLPIIFGSYSNMSDSIFEMIRYINVYLIYKIVKSSDNKKLYVNGIIVVTLLQCLIGIDGIANRYLQNALSFFDSGYLNRDVTRISSTIQYANTFAILCAISLMLVIYKITKVKNEDMNNKKNIVTYLVNYMLMFIFVTSIILSGSRLAMIMSVVAILIYIIKNKKSNFNMMFVLFSELIQAIIYSTVIYNFMSKKQIYIYAIFLVSLVINALIGYISYKLRIYFDNKEKNVKNLTAKKSFIFTAIVLFTVLYIVLGLNLPKDLKVIAESKENVISRNLYNVVSGDNNILININSLDEDTRYKIHVSAIDKEFNPSLIKTINYYENSSGKFNIEFENNDKKIKYVTLQIICEKGIMQLDDVVFNGKKQKLDYHILPGDVVCRIKDSLHGSSSMYDRVEYMLDSFKIVSKSPVSLAVGVGGKGFSNMYETVQGSSYISSEPHSFALQILVESGILGFLLFLILVIFAFKLTKSSIYRYVFLLFLVHAIFDLDMAFMLCLSIFAVLLGLLEYKEKYEKNEKTILFALSLISFCMCIFSIAILFKANMAFYTQIPEYDRNTLTVEKQREVLEKVESRVILDNFEIGYKTQLHNSYADYLKMLKATMLVFANNEDTYQSAIEISKVVVNNMEKNLQAIQKYDKYNKYSIYTVSNAYYNNMDDMIQLNYSDNQEEGYKYYLNIIVESVDKLYQNYKYNSKAKEMVRYMCKEYIKDLEKKNETIKSQAITDAINILKQYEI